MEIIPLYENVKVLLHDICSFLQKEVVNATKLEKTETKKIANELIRRSITQILEIEQVTAPDYLDMRIKRTIKPISVNTDEYVDSDAKSNEDNANNDNNVYSNPDEKEREVKVEVIDTLICPFKGSLFTDIKSEKEGNLSRKEHLLHFLPRPRKYFVVICEDWLLFYNGNRKGTPLETYYLKSCEAKALDDSSNIFEIHINGKSFITMIANSRKEKLQWINVINDKANMENDILNKPIKTPDKIKHDSIDSNPIYEEVHEDPSKDTSIKNEELPSLPPPRQMNVYSNYDTDEIYDLVQSPSEKDQIYDYLRPMDTVDEIYDYVKEKRQSDEQQPH